MKFVTFNIRTEAMCDGVNRFFHRRGFILDKIEKEKPDIIGFQEVKEEMQAYLRPHLNALGYTLLGTGRDADYRGEHNPIAYLSEKYEPISLDVSWLSDTPSVPGSRYEIQSSCPRIITHMLLKPLEGGSAFHVFNTHLDHMEAYARINGAHLLMEKIGAEYEKLPLPVILCGDFNAYPDSEESQFIINHPFGFTELTSGMGTTWHNWGKGSEPRIDYIFTKGFKTDKVAVKWDDNLNGVYLSDHYPIAVEIECE